MPRVKKEQQLYGIKWALLPEIETYVSKRGVRLSLEEAETLIKVSTRPEIMQRQRTHGDDIHLFGKLYSRRPDLTIDLMKFIRGKLAYWQQKQGGFVELFLRTHSPNTPIKIGNSRQTVGSASDGDLATFLTRDGLDISTDSVKEARHSITRSDNDLTFRHSPEVLAYQRTGAMTPKLEALLKTRREREK